MLRQRLHRIIDSSLFSITITGLIILNAVTLGLETIEGLSPAWQTAFAVFDRLVLTIFAAEIFLKLYVHRTRFFHSGWNWFDAIIVGFSLIPASGPLSVLRALRVLRVLRLLSLVPQLRRIVIALGHSIPGMASVVGILALVFYVASVLATKLFGTSSDPQMQEWFGTITASAYTLFQIMTLESWSMGIVRPTMELFPWSWIFFLPFIIVTSFAVLNFFIGIVVDSMQVAQRLEDEENGITPKDPATTQDIAALDARLERIEKAIHNIGKSGAGGGT